jgi:hypothetical protein
MIARLARIIACALPLFSASAARAEPQTVFFKSADGATEIVGYLFKPTTPGPHPAIVLMHGRAGPYSANDNAGCTFVGRGARSACNASTLSKRHVMWGEFWAARGVLALLPDSFGPRGKAHGFGRFSHGDRDRDDVNEKTVRPLDAEGAFEFLHRRDDVVGNRIFLQGWSNGGRHDIERDDPSRCTSRRLPRSPRILSRLRTRCAARAEGRDLRTNHDVPRQRRRGGLAGDLPAGRPTLDRGRRAHLRRVLFGRHS